MGDKLGRERYLNYGGFLINGEGKNWRDDPPERRVKVINEYLDQGGFCVLFAYNGE